MSDTWGSEQDEEDGEPPFALELAMVDGPSIKLSVPHATAARTARERLTRAGDGLSRADLAQWLSVYWAAIMQPSEHTLSVLDAAGTWWAIRRERISHIRVVDSSPDGSRPTKMGFQMPEREAP